MFFCTACFSSDLLVNFWRMSLLSSALSRTYFLVIMTCQGLHVTWAVFVTVMTNYTIHMTICERVEIAVVYPGCVVWLPSNLPLCVFTFVDLSHMVTEQLFSIKWVGSQKKIPFY
jgi:hypothetical protein